MIQLVIDSATPACSVALITHEGELLGERHEIVGRGHAERLVPMIQDLLDSRRPDSILVDCGPGSFTGIRVGLAAAQGLAIGWNVPLSGFSSLSLLASASGEMEVAIALLAGHGELFVQSFAGDPIAPLDSMRSLPPNVAAQMIDSDLVVGSGAETLVTLRGHGRWKEALPRAADARRLPPALRQLLPRPIYGRLPDAQPMT